VAVRRPRPSIRWVKEMVRPPSKPLDIFIWGGVSTPEAAAAFLSTGAAGIVFESVHWLTDMVAIDDFQRRQLSRLRLEFHRSCRPGPARSPVACSTRETRVHQRDQGVSRIPLCGAKVKEESPPLLRAPVHARALHPLESRFGQTRSFPLGVEAAFAASFVERFGAGTEDAVKAFMDEIRHVCRLAEAKKSAFWTAL